MAPLTLQQIYKKKGAARGGLSAPQEAITVASRTGTVLI